MITAGLDIGNRSVKAVLLLNDKILSHSIVLAAADSTAAGNQALNEALEVAGLSREAIEHLVVTGAGRHEVSFAQQKLTEVSCDAVGAVWLFPAARTVIDIGAEECRCIKCNNAGTVIEFVMNDKCASGAGIFLESMAKALEIDVRQMGELSLQAQKDLKMSTTCAVFAESEVVSLVHSGEKTEDILNAIHSSITSRTASMLARTGIEKDVLMVGGVARNAGMVDALKREIGLDVFVPENPELVGALGAALHAFKVATDPSVKFLPEVKGHVVETIKQ